MCPSSDDFADDSNWCDEDSASPSIATIGAEPAVDTLPSSLLVAGNTTACP